MIDEIIADKQVYGIVLRGGRYYTVVPGSIGRHGESLWIAFQAESLFQQQQNVIQQTVDVYVHAEDIVAVETNPKTLMVREGDL